MKPAKISPSAGETCLQQAQQPSQYGDTPRRLQVQTNKP